MPFDPQQIQGDLPDYDIQEFNETGLLTTGVTFTPRVNIREKTGHLPGATSPGGGFNQILQVQTIRQALDIELTAEIVPNAEGKATGLANAYPGQVVTSAHFAAGADSSIHGFERDAAKLLMVKEVTRTLSNEAESPPGVTVPLTYYPHINFS